jgi:hypothetical protein
MTKHELLKGISEICIKGVRECEGEMKLLEIIDETKLTTAQKQEKLEDLGKVIGMLEAYDRIMKFVEKEINIANNETE